MPFPAPRIPPIIDARMKGTPMTQVADAPGTAEEILRPRDTPARRIHNLLHRMPALSPLIVLVLACIVFGLANGRFFRPENISIVLQQAAVVGSLAVGQTLIILTAGIDLSVGAVDGAVHAGHGQAGRPTAASPAPLALLVGIVIAVARRHAQRRPGDPAQSCRRSS